jgi:polysaccharide export outer membrane protein
MRKIFFLLFFYLVASPFSKAQLTGLNLNSIKSITGLGTTPTTPPPSSKSAMQMAGLDPSIQAMLGASMGASTTTASSSSDNSGPLSMLSSLMDQMLSLKSTQDSLVNASTTANGDDTLNKRMPSDIFGQDFFTNTRLKLFVKASETRAPDEYIIGEGDELTVSVWGFADYNNTLKVNKEGYIQIPEFGRIYVKGMTFGAVKGVIAKRLSSFINPSNTKYEITLNYSRSIEVNIVGEVYLPGTYQIPAINSVYNALNAADGITNIGSIRNIEIRRAGKTIKTFDVYEFLTNPFNRDNFFLQEGDFIYVPPIGNVIDIKGSVRRQGKYELKSNEGIPELIKFAGGLSADAYGKLAKLERFNSDQIDLVDVPLNKIMEGNLSFSLKDGDKLIIDAISGNYINYVSISGTIKFPGKYELSPNYRLSDVIQKAGGILRTTYMERGYIRRVLDNQREVVIPFNLNNILLDYASADNILLQELDQITLYNKQDFLEQFTVSIQGSVMKPTIVKYAENITLNDLLFMAGGLKKEAANNKIEIFRVFEKKDENGIIMPIKIIIKSIEVGPNLEIDEATKSFKLMPMDEVQVRKTYEYSLPQNVTIMGEIKFPGTYPIQNKDEKLLNIIERAGGLTPYAFVASATITRTDPVKGVEILHLKDAFIDPNSYANYVLKEGDLITIPLIDELVRVKGDINYPNLDSNQTIAGKYIAGKRAKYYIKRYAAGFGKYAKKKYTIVQHANGAAESTKSFLGIKRYPKVFEGSEITVSTNMKKKQHDELPEMPKEALNWNYILPSIIAAITSVASTLTLVFILKN